MKQLHLRKTFTLMHWKQLTHEQRLKVLESHMFLKKKRLDGKVKWQTVDGGNKLQSYISKEDASLPTIATKSVLLTYITDT